MTTAGIDPAVAQKIHDTVLAVFASDAVKPRLVELGITHTPMSSDDYTALVAKMIDVWAPLIRSAGIAE